MRERFEQRLFRIFAQAGYSPVQLLTITPEEMYRRLPVEVPGTSLPSGEVVEGLFRRIREAGCHQVLAVTLSSGLSGTCQFLRMMAEDAGDLEVHIVDSRNIGIASGVCIRKIGHAATAGSLQISQQHLLQVGKNIGHLLRLFAPNLEDHR